MQKNIGKMEFLLHHSAHEIKMFLQIQSWVPQKRLGQNFLVHPLLRREFIEAFDPQEGEEFWEIGPGLGSLTELLLEYPLKAIRLFELDHGYAHYLRLRYAQRALVITGDALQELPLQRGSPHKIVGNLPYHITHDILHLLVAHENLRTAESFFLVQKEASQRWKASIEEPNYSVVSILAQSFYDIETLFSVPRDAFYPRPHVDSVLIRLRPRKKELSEYEVHSLLHLLRVSFSHRRKTLATNWKKEWKDTSQEYQLLEEVLKIQGHTLQTRAEVLSPDEWKNLARCFSVL